MVKCIAMVVLIAISFDSSALIQVDILPSHQLPWFLASITSTRNSNPDLPAPCPVALPLGHRVGIKVEVRIYYRFVSSLSCVLPDL